MSHLDAEHIDAAVIYTGIYFDSEGTSYVPAELVSTLTAWSRDVQPLLFQKCGSCHDYYVSPVNLDGVSSSFIDPRLSPSTEIGTVRVCTGANNSTCTDQPGQVSRIKLVKPGHPELSSLYRRINHLNTTIAPFSATVPIRGFSTMGTPSSRAFRTSSGEG